MRCGNRWKAALLILAAVALPACSRNFAAEVSAKDEPASIEPVEGTDLNRVILLPEAAERLGIKTAPAQEISLPADGTKRLAVPYASLLYQPNGDTLVYTSPEPLTYVRNPVTVDYVDGDLAVLLDGPPAGTSVAIVGASELFGIEFGIGK